MNHKMNGLEKRAAFSLAGLYALRMFGLFSLLPVLAIAAAGFHGASPSSIGLAMGIYGATQACLQVPFGMLSDRIGRKPVIILGLVLFAIGSLVAASSESISSLIIGRAMQGAGAISSSILALAADLSRAEQRSKMMAIIGISIGGSFVLAIILGPILVAALQLSGLFLVISTLSIAAIAMVIWVVPSTVTRSFHADTDINLRKVKAMLTDPALLRLNFGVLILHMALTGFFLLIPPLLVSELNLATENHWHLYVPTVLLGFILMSPMLRQSEPQKMRRTFLVAIAVMSIAITLTVPAIHYSYTMLFVIMLLLFASFNYLEATQPALVSRLAPPAGRGTAMGLYSQSQFFGTFLGGALVGSLHQYFGITAAMSFLALLFIPWWWLSKDLQIPENEKTEMFTISKYWLNKRQQLTEKLIHINGVIEAILPENEDIAYLRVNKNELNRDALLQLFTDPEQTNNIAS
jgi:MFS family permease